MSKPGAGERQAEYPWWASRWSVVFLSVVSLVHLLALPAGNPGSIVGLVCSLVALGLVLQERGRADA